MIKAACYSHSGDPDVLTYGDVPDPVVGSGDVLVKVEAISIEGGDVISRRLETPSSERHVAGYQAGGVVAAVGAAVTRFKLGQRVCGSCCLRQPR